MTGVLPPEAVDHAATDWQDQADLLIVGGGIAGVCAAIEARRAGLDVIIAESASGLGGTSALSGGHFYLGGGTAVQKACDFDDTAEEMYRYLVAVSSEPDHAKIRAFAGDSVSHFEWLEAQGVPFDRSYYPQKTPMQPGRDCLIWSGNEQGWPYRETITPAPRGHKVDFDGPDGGGALAMRALTAKLSELDAKLHCDTRVQRLFTTESGGVCGVAATHFDAPVKLGARRGVLLATGGHAFNDALMLRYSPDRMPPHVTPMGSPHNLGAGLLLGLSVGGQGEHMDSVFLASPFYPPEQLIKGIIVNAQGARFVAEDSYHGRTSEFIFRQPDGKAYLILDSQIFAYPEGGEVFNHALVDGWDTVAEMSVGLDVPPAALEASLQSYNTAAAEKKDPAFHKGERWLIPLETPPYAAFDLSVGKALYRGFSLGGLRTSVDAEVLDAEGNPIPGLWAAGACASNISQDCVGYSSGTQLAEGSYFGRRAGRTASKAGTGGRRNA